MGASERNKEEVRVYVGIDDDGNEFVYLSDSPEHRRQKAIQAFLGIKPKEDE